MNYQGINNVNIGKSSHLTIIPFGMMIQQVQTMLMKVDEDTYNKSFDDLSKVYDQRMIFTILDKRFPNLKKLMMVIKYDNLKNPELEVIDENIMKLTNKFIQEIPLSKVMD